MLVCSLRLEPGAFSLALSCVRRALHVDSRDRIHLVAREPERAVGRRDHMTHDADARGDAHSVYGLRSRMGLRSTVCGPEWVYGLQSAVLNGSTVYVCSVRPGPKTSSPNTPLDCRP